MTSTSHVSNEPRPGHLNRVERHNLIRSLLMGAWLGLTATSSALAAERVWSGAGTDALWSNPANWQNGTPQSGDSVLFPVGATKLSNTNDITSLSVTHLRIEASALRLSGEELSLESGISYSSEVLGLVVELTLPLKLAGSLVEINAAQGCTIRVTGTMSAPATTVLALDGGGDIRFNGPVLGAFLASTWFKRGFFPGSGFSGPLFRNAITVGGTTNFASFVLQTGNQFANSPSMTVLTNGHLINVATLNHVGSLRVEGGLITLNGASPNGRITVNGDAFFGPGSSLRTTALSSGVPGELSITGRVSIAGCSFKVLPTGGIISSTSVIIQNDGTDPIQGTFDDLPEGGLFSESQRIFKVSYRGGDGNDFTISPIGQLAFRSILSQPSNRMQLLGLSTTNLKVTLESTLNLAFPNWQPRGTSIPNTNGAFEFLDLTNPNEPARFYRARQE